MVITLPHIVVWVKCFLTFILATDVHSSDITRNSKYKSHSLSNYCYCSIKLQMNYGMPFHLRMHPLILHSVNALSIQNVNLINCMPSPSTSYYISGQLEKPVFTQGYQNQVYLKIRMQGNVANEFNN